jgi:peptidoglycan/LPS O-acetylase OafA/YrhL
VHHAFLFFPFLLAPYWGRPIDPAWQWLIYSPLHLLWAGNEAVIVFFLLSGIVLTLPVIRSSRGFAWAAFYPSRLIRLYVPTIASVAFAVAVIQLVPRASDPALTPLPQPITASSIVHNLTLIAGTDTLNGPLWSLQLEVLFSLLLPLYVFVAVKLRRWWWAVVIVCLAAALVGSQHQKDLIEYLPVFMIGTILAVRTDLWERAVVWIQHLRFRRVAWPVLFVVILLGVILRWLSPALNLRELAPAVIVFAAILVLLAMYWSGFRGFLETRFVQWLGKISFSLYLVHAPIITAYGLLLPASLAWLEPILSVPTALLFAWGFFRIIERPAHRLSQSVRRRIDLTTSAVTAARAT